MLFTFGLYQIAFIMTIFAATGQEKIALQQKFISACIMAAGKTEAVSMKSIPGDIPQYLLIKAQLQARIQSGALKSGDKLPSERELCAIFNTTRITIRESLAQLESSGLIWRADRRGWFVTPERLWLDPTQNTNFHKLCREQGGSQKPRY